MLNNFNEYLINKLFEDVNKGEAYLVFSERFKQLLLSIDDSISKRLIHSEKSDSVKKTFIDIDDSSFDKITFITVPKVVDIISQEKGIEKKDVKLDINVYYNYGNPNNTIMYDKHRVPMKVSKFINEIYKDEYKTKPLTQEEKDKNKAEGILTKPQELDNFIDSFKSFRQPGNFELVNGKELLHWYLVDNYPVIEEYDKKGTLGTSCMRDEQSQEYLGFYANNPDKVSLLVLKDRKDENIVIARALIWKLDSPKDRIFMDRVYTTYQFDTQLFIKYAKEQGWLYKQQQSSSENTFIVDPMNDTTTEMKLVVQQMESHDYYPYLDTLKYYSDYDTTLTNYKDYFDDSEEIYYLEGIHGDDHENMNTQEYTYDELVDRFINDIMDDFEYYVINFIGSSIWQYVDDEDFVRDHINSEIEYYVDDFEHAINVDFIIDYIKEHTSDTDLENNLKYDKDDYNDVWEKLGDLADSEIFELTDELDIKSEIAESYANDRYGNSTAKDITSELGYDIYDINAETYNMISYYIDERETARDYANDEDETWLREHYDDE